MLSLTPRFDLFQFDFPRDWFPDELIKKYAYVLSKNQAVITDPVEYINESIQGITIPGLSDLTIDQQQTSTNANPLGRMRYNREPNHPNAYKTPDNPLAHIDREFKVTMRQNQGLMNYFMMYESIFWHLCKPQMFDRGEDSFLVRFCDEHGTVNAVMNLIQPIVTGINGLEFSYSKVERTAETFDVTFTFNNIDFDLIGHAPKE